REAEHREGSVEGAVGLGRLAFLEEALPGCAAIGERQRPRLLEVHPALVDPLLRAPGLARTGLLRLAPDEADDHHVEHRLELPDAAGQARGARLSLRV